MFCWNDTLSADTENILSGSKEKAILKMLSANLEMFSANLKMVSGTRKPILVYP